MSIQQGTPLAAPPGNRLIDQHGRTFDYLRVAVTEQCNLRCVYCMPEEGVPFIGSERMLTADEILRVIRVAEGLGVKKIRYTGGEPLVRKGIVELVAETCAIDGIENVHLTTNGVLLHRFGKPLLDAGLTGLNISLDTLDEQKFEKITRRPGLRNVIEAIETSVAQGYPSVKVNVVAMHNFNDDEFGAFAELTRDLPITVRFIELMPFDARQIWKTGRFFRAGWIIDVLRKTFPELAEDSGSPTEQHVFRVSGYAGKIAVIPAYTRSLCGGCNRVRLTADGQIRNCLYSEDEFDLRTILRNGGPDEELIATLKNAVWRKKIDGWAAQKSGKHTGERISMTQIGG